MQVEFLSQAEGKNYNTYTHSPRVGPSKLNGLKSSNIKLKSALPINAHSQKTPRGAPGDLTHFSKKKGKEDKKEKKAEAG